MLCPILGQGGTADFFACDPTVDPGCRDFMFQIPKSCLAPSAAEPRQPARLDARAVCGIRRKAAGT